MARFQHHVDEDGLWESFRFEHAVPLQARVMCKRVCIYVYACACACACMSGPVRVHMCAHVHARASELVCESVFLCACY